MASRKVTTRLMASLPAFLVTACWPGIWLLWPLLGTSEAPCSRPSPPRVSVVDTGTEDSGGYRSPVVFGPPSPVGFSARATEKHELGLLSHRAALPVRLLPRQRAAGLENRSEGAAWTFQEPLYTPRLAPLNASRPSGAMALEVRVFPDRALRQCGFILPELPPQIAGHTNMPWQVTARIDIDAAGRVRHVFVEPSEQNAETVRWVEHYLGLGRAEAARGPRSGDITVSCAAR